MGKNGAKDFFIFGEGKEIVDVSEVFLEMVSEKLENTQEMTINQVFKMQRKEYEYQLEIEGMDKIWFFVTKGKFRMTILYHMKQKEFSYAYSEIWLEHDTTWFPLNPLKKENQGIFEDIFMKIIEIASIYTKKMDTVIDNDELEERLQNKKKQEHAEQIDNRYEEMKRILKKKLEE